MYERDIEVKNGSKLESCPLLAQGKGLELSEEEMTLGKVF